MRNPGGDERHNQRLDARTDENVQLDMCPPRSLPGEVRHAYAVIVLRSWNPAWSSRVQRRTTIAGEVRCTELIRSVVQPLCSPPHRRWRRSKHRDISAW